ncbi:MAG TPA: symmetrical bis(5'-nucleosyl)-tetraphosphatase [Nitrospiraceae bacterium]|nr:symmetrical bis(5'-nucleosyl)-tetraphosphatase [Nitrospiraceae bacterium]
MAIYAIGDVQGCDEALQRLIERIQFDPKSDRLWFVGDLVNRGPGSLKVIRYIKRLGPAAQVVLGNHDLFLLAAAEDIVTLRSKDTIQDVLAAEDRAELIDWLRRQPLHYRERSFFMVHAGLLPQWTFDEAVNLAREVEAVLSGPNYRSILEALFRGYSPRWDSSLAGNERLTSITRVLTKLRTCTSAGDLSGFSGPPDEAPAGFLPWFRHPNRRQPDTTIVCGHWAALGLHIEPTLIAIDSGCIWGRQLTAIRLDDRRVFQVDGVKRGRRDSA